MFVGVQNPGQQASPMLNLLERQKLLRAEEEAAEDQREWQERQMALGIAKLSLDAINTLRGAGTGGGGG